MRPSFETADRYRRGRPRRRPIGSYRYVRLRWRVLFTCLDWIGWAVVRLARGWKDRLGLVPPRFAEPRSILLVQLDHLGDSIISTVMLPLLRARYPRARIDVLASSWNREVFAAAPEVDKVHVSRVNRFSRRHRLLWLPATLGWAWRLRRQRYDLAVDIRGEFPLALLIWLSGARRRLGWDCGGGGFLLTDSPRFAPRRPEVATRLALLAQLGIHPREDADLVGPRIDPGDRARREIARRLADVATPGRPLFVLHVTAGTAAKRWPIHCWQRLIERLIVEHRVQIIIVGAEEDRGLSADLAGRLSVDDVFDWTGQLRFVELAALLEQADLFVGADSGPAHLASAVNTAAVVLFSGTNDSRQWRPWGSRIAVVRQEVACSPCHRTECFWADHPCMQHLAVSAVMREIEHLWRELDRANIAGWHDPLSRERRGVADTLRLSSDSVPSVPQRSWL